MLGKEQIRHWIHIQMLRSAEMAARKPKSGETTASNTQRLGGNNVFGKRDFECFLMLAACLLGLSVPSPLGAQMQQMQQIQKQAQYVAQRPMKVDIKALEQGPTVGSSVPVEITLRDSNNQPVKTKKDMVLEVEMIGRSGAFHKKTVEIKAGESSKKVELTAKEVGLSKLKVRHKADELLGGSSSVLIRPKSSSKQEGSVKAPPGIKKPAPARPRPTAFIIGQALLVPALYRSTGPMNVEPGSGVARFVFPALTQETGLGSPGGPAGRRAKRLMLEVSDRGITGFLADGKDAAKVSVYYLSDDGTPAPSEIQVWLRRTHGEMDQQPLKIKRGELSAEARLTSLWPVEAKVYFVSSYPKFEVEGQKEFSVKFVPPIYGIALIGPSRLSIVDNETLVARFFDHNAKPIQAGTKRKVSFVNKNPKVHLKPVTVDVEPESSEARTVLLPTAFGTSDIEASTPGYTAAIYTVEVTAGTVIILWLVGGLLGGLSAYRSFRGSLFWRIFVGFIAAGVLTWAYVFGALPMTTSTISHNTISVFFVSILGGYLGIRGLDFTARKLKFI